MTHDIVINPEKKIEGGKILSWNCDEAPDKKSLRGVGSSLVVSRAGIPFLGVEHG